ncbi:MAG: stage II sporulation protein D [Clostridia bacterium]|nr:stage II sporulation protein D [Clostridia bacterium]
MKPRLIICCFLTLYLLLIPLVFNNVLIKNDKTDSTEKETTLAVETTEEIKELSVFRESKNETLKISTNEYIYGCVSAEISPSFKEEAIKAQAVLCYTYTLWMIENADNTSFFSADISDNDDFQSYYSKDELEKLWGDKFEIYYEKIVNCCDEVFGEYITYKNEVILPYFHAVSPGKTESEKNIFGSNLPYLKSVSAPGDILSPTIDSTVTLTKEQFKEKIELSGKLTLKKDFSKWLGKIQTEGSGYVSEIEIGGKKFDGNEIKTIFSLKSPCFSVKLKDESFVFSVKGVGIPLGMSQYSADYMARQGSNYKEIISHFFSGVEIKK